MNENIVIKGARQNNLKNIDVTVPRDKLVVFTGLSGSGKSTLAFETIYAEGQRRYVESLSSYARMFLGQMEKPDVDLIEGLSPAISIDQKTTSHNPRSTVGTVTEIYDYMRLLFARTGVPHCPNCGREIARQTVDTICDKVMALPEGTKIFVNAPVVRGKKGEYQKELTAYKKSVDVFVRLSGIVPIGGCPIRIACKQFAHCVTRNVLLVGVHEYGRRAVYLVVCKRQRSVIESVMYGCSSVTYSAKRSVQFDKFVVVFTAR